MIVVREYFLENQVHRINICCIIEGYVVTRFDWLVTGHVCVMLTPWSEWPWGGWPIGLYSLDQMAKIQLDRMRSVGEPVEA